MPNAIATLASSATILIGFGTPALAASFSATGPVTAFMESSPGITSEEPNYSGDWTDILDGSATAATGNLELNDDTDRQDLTTFLDSTTKGTLTADFGNGFDVTFSSLTAVDWFGTGLNTNYGANNLANRWFSAALASNGGKLGYLVETEFGGNVAAAFNFFLNHKGFQRLSDPNIAYVHKIGSAVNFGLAGHQNAGQVFDNPALQQLFAGIHASEVFAITYKGDTSYGYSFDEPFTSGVVNAKDGFSHNGTFDFTLVTLDNPELPEPSAAIALMAVGGGLVALKKRSNNE